MHAETNEAPNDHSSGIVDTRFQSYARVYIYDLLNSEIIDSNQTGSNSSKKNIIKINGIYLHKVSVLNESCRLKSVCNVDYENVIWRARSSIHDIKWIKKMKDMFLNGQEIGILFFLIEIPNS